MSHALVQRMSIIPCQPFLKTLEFSCPPYPQCVSELQEVVVLPLHPGPTFLMGR
jgi:hypothetical protein